ncbi:hypothetical protein ASZ78_006132 [Callipepla squamata]|uniref:Major facilitator superfamily (MFS) profile domain-containing protein n=1 Tax=Callipepla squamata TaxID=9009 RepID=A0A226MZC4_CALSU|nr:hypothetical protein ASZ78_006132 [Callipepla squamata]
MITMVASFIEMAGQFLMPGLAALCRDWQVLQAVIICPFLLMLLYWLLTGYGIHHCFAKSMMGHEAKMTITQNFYADYYTMAGIALASCLAMCPVVGFLGRRGGLLLFMILTALASLLQLGLLNCMSDSVKDKFSTAFSIVGMFSSHAVGSLSVFFCAEITPTVIRGGGLGLVLASAGFGRLTAPIMELHNQKGYFLHHVIFACCTLICIICILLLPESKNQNLPENIPDGEHYTRQPLLPHKKGEQPLLLTNSELKDYSGLHDSATVSDGISENTTANGMKSM